MTLRLKFAAAAVAAALTFVGLAAPAYATGTAPQATVGYTEHPTHPGEDDVVLTGSAECLKHGWKAVWFLTNNGDTAVKIARSELSPAVRGFSVPDSIAAGETVTVHAVYRSEPKATLKVWLAHDLALTGGHKKPDVESTVERCKCTPQTPPTTVPTTPPTTPPTTSVPTTPSTTAPTTQPPTTAPPATGPVTSEPTTEPPAAGAPGNGGGALPLTGPAAPAIVGAAVLLLAAGAVALVLARRRRARFVA